MYSPAIESVEVMYRAADEVSGTACPGLITSATSCVFTIPQPGMYTVSVEVTNSIGTTTASTSFVSNGQCVDQFFNSSKSQLPFRKSFVKKNFILLAMEPLLNLRGPA